MRPRERVTSPPHARSAKHRNKNSPPQGAERSEAPKKIFWTFWELLCGHSITPHTSVQHLMCNFFIAN